MSPPLVSVIRSNTQIGSSVRSDVPVDGDDTTNRTGMLPRSRLMEATEVKDAIMDIITGTPLVHNAIQGRKIAKAKRDMNNSVTCNSMTSSPRNE